MSLDYEVYVKTRRRSMRTVRSTAKAVLKRYPGASLAPVEEGEEDELSIALPASTVADLEALRDRPGSRPRSAPGGGPVLVTRHSFGLHLSISSTTGARESFEALGLVVDEIAEKLGTVLDDDEAAELLEEEDDEESDSPLADEVTLVLVGPDGEHIEEESISVASFSAQQAPGGLLRPAAGSAHTRPLLTDAGRFPLRGRRLVCTLHDGRGRAMERYDYELDGYGRIVGMSVTELD